jgi:hypothetical protein
MADAFRAIDFDGGEGFDHLDLIAPKENIDRLAR